MVTPDSKKQNSGAKRMLNSEASAQVAAEQNGNHPIQNRGQCRPTGCGRGTESFLAVDSDKQRSATLTWQHNKC
jgi:hypothetical protein